MEASNRGRAAFDSNAQVRYQRGGALVLNNLTLSHDNRLLFQQQQTVPASLSHGVITGLVGVNGAGKSSLSLLLASKELPGFPRELHVTYVSSTSMELGDEQEQCNNIDTDQLYRMMPEEYIWSKVERRIGAIQKHIDQLEGVLEQAVGVEQMEEISDRLAVLYDTQDSLTADAKAAIRDAIVKVGMQPHLQKPVASLSSGWRYKCCLISAFITKSDLLIVDEPSFLDSRSTEWFVEQMQHAAKDQNAMVLLVSHKEALLDQLCERIWYINAGNQTFATFNCGYSAFRSTHEAEIQSASKTIASTNEKVKSADKSLSQIKAQLHKREKNMQSKTKQNSDKRFIKGKNKEAQQNADKSAAAKLKQLERKATEVETLKRTAKRERVRPLRIEGTVSSERFVVQLCDVGFAYDGMKDEFVFRFIDSSVEASDRILLAGGNGCGKSTLVKIIAGQVQPTEGDVHLHVQKNMLYFPQTALSDLVEQYGQRSAMGLLNAPGIAWTETQTRQHLGNFDLKGELALRQIATLSAGQRVRLWLAWKLVQSPHPSLLVLDEISENLDVETRRSLVDMLDEFQGAVITVSHDTDLSQSFRYTQLWELTAHGLRIQHA